MILPYIEQTPVYNAMNFQLAVGGTMYAIAGVPVPTVNCGPSNATAAMTPINVFMCPTDPAPTFSTYPRVDQGVGPNNNSGPKLSYVGNFGDNHNDCATLVVVPEPALLAAQRLRRIQHRDGDHVPLGRDHVDPRHYRRPEQHLRRRRVLV